VAVHTKEGLTVSGSGPGSVPVCSKATMLNSPLAPANRPVPPVTDLRIWLAGNNGGTTFGLGQTNAPITIAKVTLQISYDRVTRSDTPTRRRILEVVPAQVVYSLGRPSGCSSWSASLYQANKGSEKLERHRLIIKCYHSMIIL
jgi:hypothetical protein